MLMTKHNLNLFTAVGRLDLNRHRYIKQALREVGSSISELSAEIGVAASTLTIVSQGHRTSHRVQSGIARKLGTTPEALFPERYRKQGGS
jgi:lambda repressor-like predicted transcriptional regulator